MKKIDELEKELQNKELNSLYLLYGEEQYLLEQTVKKIKVLFGECINGINYIQIDESNVNQLIADIETPSFGYEKKLIIAKKSGVLKKEGKRKSEELTKLKKRVSEYIANNIENNFADIIGQGAQTVCESAKSLCPVDTGLLQSSINVQPAGNTAVISADTEYAVFVEFGTSKMAAQPYLVPALLSNTQAILSAIAEAIKG